MKGLHFNKDYLQKNYYRIIGIASAVLVAAALILNIFNTKDNIVSAPETKTEEEAPKAENTEVTFADDFSDTAFVGDSRTQGLMLYSGLSKASFYTATGLTSKEVVEKPEVDTDGGKITIIDAIAQNNFARIYIALGINELGWVYPDLFKSAYGDMLDKIKEVQPNAVIYVNNIFPVNRELMKKPKDYMTNERIAEYNEIIKNVCAEKGVNFVDVASIMTDKNGNLYEQATTDGIHLNKPFCDRWIAYLKGEKIDEIVED